MSSAQQRHEFRRSLVNGLPFAVTNEDRARWQRHFEAVAKPTMSPVPRLLNHFKLGADPEFIFENSEPFRVDAQSLKLRTGLCVGADQNGRLVEIRPKADEFALRVVGSTLEELRWLAFFYPKSVQYAWKCDPYMYDDGLGGHVHFGRKRPTRTQEVVALDALGKMFLDLHIFNTTQWLRRQQGDQFRQQYGKFGDYRPQIHGYEYRTLPSWLDNPWLAYFVLVTSKLVVHDPGLVRNWPNLKSDRQYLENLLAYYKGQDDDAWIAYYALKRMGMPVHRGGDFKVNWGLKYVKVPPIPTVKILPTSIAPSAETMASLFDYFVEGKMLPTVEPVPTWSPTEVPKGFRHVLEGANTHGLAGYGELLWDACYLEDLPVDMGVLNNDSLFRVGRDLAKKLPHDWRKQLSDIAPGGKVYVEGGGYHIAVGRVWRTVAKLQLTRKALFSGVFPLWRLRDANDAARERWLGPAAADKNSTGTVLYPTKGNA